MSEVTRTNNDLYLNDKRKKNAKEYFKFLYKNLINNPTIKSKKKINIIDVGCATSGIGLIHNLYLLTIKLK
jgi:hypothetical protein